MIVYFNDEFMEKDKVCISPDDRGFLFADGLYEVIRSYKGYLFQAKEHLDRLSYGATHLKLGRTDFSELEEIARELLSRNGLESENATIYFQVTRGVAKRSHAFPTPAPALTVYAAASKFDPAAADRKRENGISAITIADTRWARCDMKTTALTANILANQAAVENDAQEAIFIRDGVMLEGTHSNFMAVFDDVLVTAPLSNYILGGITRNFILGLCRRENIKVEERPIFEKDIHMASEMMIVGTTTEITPIVRMNHTLFRAGKPGPVARALQAAYQREIDHLASLK
ncbi:MAG: D-alanine aminotransferase Dat [Desulfobacteraceae bacterium]|nr:D-alanine aminotransferase Dat [Desulfobacteraceae bacterium]